MSDTLTSKSKKSETPGSVVSIEFNLQHDCFQWTHKHLPEYRKQLFHVPNGGKRSRIEASRLKQSGTIAGIPDLIFCIQSQTFFFELKTTAGTLSSDQKLIHAKFKQNGFFVFVIRSVEQYKQIFLFIIMEKILEKFNRLEHVYDLEIYGMSKELFLYQCKVWKYIYEMELEQITIIDQICDPANREKFIDCVKRFIIFEMDKADGFHIDFNSEYSKFRKYETHDAYTKRKKETREMLFGRWYNNDLTKKDNE
jgi:hypothetical protein